MRQIILASTSVYRRELMERLKIPFDAYAPECDEDGLDHLPAEERAVQLAERKARALAPKFPEALIIGSDQIPEVEGHVLRKPRTFDVACESLRLLSGKEHRLVTGVAVVEGGEDGRVESAVNVSLLRMKELTDEQIESYVRAEQVLNCAGAYKAEGLGIALFERIESTDPTAEIGMSLIQLIDLLSRFGVTVLR